MNLIVLDPQELDDQGCVHLTDVRAVHLVKVIKVRPQQRLRVGLLNGPIGTATVLSADGTRVSLGCEWDGDTPPRAPVDLLLALPRPKVMRRLWAQIAAIGVDQIILTNAERVERDYFDAHTLAADGYRPLLIEGLMQARDTRLPDVSIHRQFRPLVEDHLDSLSRDAVRMVADPSASSSIADAVRDHRAERVLLAVGPEGGWNRFELDLLGAHRFVHVGMGPRTLRSDTACVALLALTHAALRLRSG